MIQELDNDRYFRWFDSGDIYDVRLARKILEVCEATPWVKHWIPTRMHKFPKFTLVLQRLQSLPNVALRLSSDSIMGETIEGPTTSTIATLEDAPKGSFVCEAYTRGGKCDKCRACWDKGVSVVTYIGHGKSMVKNQNNLIKTLDVA
jgi:hypothetical protein